MVDGAQEPFAGGTLEAYDAIHLRCIGAEKVYALEIPSKVRELNLSHNDLMALPERFIPQGVQRLWLADNRLTTLPTEVSKYVALTYLNLDRNRLATLPNLSNTALRWLRVNDNRLTELPALPNTLEVLHLQGNQLATFTARPKALRQLNLSGNPITSLPAYVGDGLTWLDLSQTQLTSLPENLDGWQTLKVLNLAECPLSEAEKERIERAFNPLHTTILY